MGCGFSCAFVQAFVECDLHSSQYTNHHHSWIAGNPPLPRGHDHPVAWSPDQSKDLLQGFNVYEQKICQKTPPVSRVLHLGMFGWPLVGWLSELFGLDHPLCLERLIYTVNSWGNLESPGESEWQGRNGVWMTNWQDERWSAITKKIWRFLLLL